MPCSVSHICEFINALVLINYRSFHSFGGFVTRVILNLILLPLFSIKRYRGFLSTFILVDFDLLEHEEYRFSDMVSLLERESFYFRKSAVGEVSNIA